MATIKSETLVQHHPPTPPNVTTELQYGLHHIAQHNAEGNYQLDDQLLNRHGSAYGSPAPMMQEGIPSHSTQNFHNQLVEASQFPDHHSSDFNLDIQYNNYGDPPSFYQPDSQYNGVHNNQGMFSGSPPTPRSGIDNEEVRRTRSGRSIPAVPETPQKERPRAKPKSKKAKVGKADKPKTPKLTAPLSILTKDYAHIPVRNMKEWVERPPDVRKKEVEKRNGYVTRPMNSFMLYRSAYAERTKQWCLQNNHQIVSSVSGESWPMEPAEVRDMYNELAKIERINHQNAHPTYKFSPSKTTIPPKRKKGEFLDEEPSDLDDGAWDPSGHRRTRNKGRRQERGVGYPSNALKNNGFFTRTFGPDDGMNKSHWDMSNDGRPLPLPMNQNDLYHHYFQTNNMSMAGLEDMRMPHVDTSGSQMQFSQGHPLLGLPGGNAVDFIQQFYSHTGTPLGDDHQVDPMLLAFDGGNSQDTDPTMALQPEFRNGHLIMERELDQAGVNSLLGTTNPSHDDFHTEPWHADPTITSLEPGSEFDKWMDDHHTA